MKLTHLASSTQLIQVGSSLILTDPWLVDGEYYGSWHHAPPYVGPIAKLVYDYIYLSHIHPDHFSRKTFELLPRNKPVLIQNYRHKFLKWNLERLGFQVIELDQDFPYPLKDGQITILAADNCNPALCSKFMGCGQVEVKLGSTQIDSMALFEDNHHSVLNVNDLPFELAGAALDLVSSRVKDIDLLLVGYAGAGPYPQCFTFDDPADMMRAADQKKLQFLRHGLDYIKRIKPKFYMPFAGTYTLGGRLAKKNAFRGAPTLGEAGEWFKEQLVEQGQASQLIQLDSLECFDLAIPEAVVEFHPWSSEQISGYANETLAGCAYDFDQDPTPSRQQLEEMLVVASKRFFLKKTEVDYISSYILAVFISETEAFVLDLAEGKVLGILQRPAIYEREKYVTISLDLKLLFRLLSGPKHGHWNNAEIGSHLTYERMPSVFERSLYHCICFLHV